MADRLGAQKPHISRSAFYDKRVQSELQAIKILLQQYVLAMRSGAFHAPHLAEVERRSRNLRGRMAHQRRKTALRAQDNSEGRTVSTGLPVNNRMVCAKRRPIGSQSTATAAACRS